MNNYLQKTKVLLLGITMTLLSALAANAQGREVTGTVISGEDNLALPGVSVLVKGTTRGGVTDLDGRFSLNVQPGEILAFSFIGYITQEVTIQNQTSVDITLQPDMQSLSEVVVVGYGEQKKETITGSVASVQGAELVKSPAMNLSNSIAGRMAGVIAVNQVTMTQVSGSGAPIHSETTTP